MRYIKKSYLYAVYASQQDRGHAQQQGLSWWLVHTSYSSTKLNNPSTVSLCQAQV